VGEMVRGWIVYEDVVVYVQHRGRFVTTQAGLQFPCEGIGFRRWESESGRVGIESDVLPAYEEGG
jgi:hypothetical protein